MKLHSCAMGALACALCTTSLLVVAWRNQQINEASIWLNYISPSKAIITGDINILRACGLGNAMWIAANVIAAASKSNRTAVLPHTRLANSPVFANFPKVKVSSQLLDGETSLQVPESRFGFELLRWPNQSNSHLPVQVLGYRQSWRYFACCNYEVCEAFSLRPANNEQVSALLRPLLEPNLTTVGIHVRRGDYLLKPAVHPVLPSSYYEHALAALQRKLGVSTSRLLVFVFSDDPSVEKETPFVSLPHVRFVTSVRTTWWEAFVPFVPRNWIPRDGANGEEWVHLYALAHMKHHIIANSSFGWWAAFLAQCKKLRDPSRTAPLLSRSSEAAVSATDAHSERGSGIVIAPSKWVGPQGPRFHTTDMHMSGWISLSV